MCTRPRLEIDKLGRLITNVPCKMCIECRNMRREEFTERLLHEWQTAGYIGSFITLTYRDEQLPILLPENSAVVGHWFKSVPPAYGSTLSRKEISQFADKMQKRLKRQFGKSGKYVLVGEYGDDGHRPHYHGIYIGLPSSERKMLYECWNKGKVDIQAISHAAVRYTLKYIDKQIFGVNDLYYNYGDFEPPFAHFSKGLGVQWIKDNLDKFDRDGKIRYTDSKSYTLTPYFKDKFRFIKPHKMYSEAVIKFAKEHHLSVQEAYEKRARLKELYLQRKELRETGTLYNVDTIEKMKMIDKLND